MPTARIPLFGSIESRDYKSFTDGFTADTMIKYDQGGTDVQFDVLTDLVNGKKVGYFYPRENFATSGVPAGTGAGVAIHCWTGNANKIVTAYGTTSTVYVDSTTQGAITGQAAFITEGVHPVTGAANIFVTNATGANGYYGTGAGSLTEFSDTDYPTKTPALTTTGPFVQMGGYTFIMTTVGKIYNSDGNSISAWTTDAFCPANQRPDAGIGVALYQNSLVAFSLSSTEFFYNAGLTPSPLSAEANYINLGCANQYAYCNIADTVAFFSTSNGYGIYVLEGRRAKKISTPPIDRILAGSTASAVRLNPFVSFGKLFLLVTAPVTAGQLAYDMASETWHLWIFTGNQVTQSDIVPSSASSSSVYVGPSITSYFATSATGKAGTFLTGKFDGGTNKRKFLRSVGVIGAMGSTSSATVSVAWSDDDYETFSTARSVNINSSERPVLNRCGSFTTRAFKVTATNDNSGRIARVAALELDYEVGQ